MILQASKPMQRPSVGRALKLHGQPQSQLQAVKKSASKFHFVMWYPSLPINHVMTNRQVLVLFDLALGRATICPQARWCPDKDVSCLMTARIHKHRSAEAPRNAARTWRR